MKKLGKIGALTFVALLTLLAVAVAVPGQADTDKLLVARPLETRVQEFGNREQTVLVASASAAKRNDNSSSNKSTSSASKKKKQARSPGLLGYGVAILAAFAAAISYRNYLRSQMSNVSLAITALEYVDEEGLVLTGVQDEFDHREIIRTPRSSGNSSDDDDDDSDDDDSDDSSDSSDSDN